MTFAPRTLTLALVLLAATGSWAVTAAVTGTPGPLQEARHLLSDPMPDLPVGALVFAALGWWILMRPRPPRDADFND